MIRTITLLACATILCAGCASKDDSHPAAEPRFPVRTTESFGVDVTEIEGTLDESVYMGALNERGNHRLVLRKRMDDGEEVTIEPATPREYLKLRAEGYCAMSTFDITMESFFIRRTRPLIHLSYAKPSEKSYVSDLRLDEIDAGTLPGVWFHLGEYPESPFATLTDYDPEFRVEDPLAESLTIWCGTVVNTFDVVAWGDFDGDGIEDVLLSYGFLVTDGTWRGYGHVFLTRLTPEGPLTGDTWVEYKPGRWQWATFGGEARQAREDEARRRLVGE